MTKFHLFSQDPGMSEYAFGILNWLGNRTYRGVRKSC